ncbi:hypothetical protein [Rappaport israeli]|uniref:hypothetical protein n=1 Tax=Rappaport israeli TaxID=1839807 RepID=UPI000B09CFA7|nr:hypothetical protein [Rappaport israeli]
MCGKIATLAHGALFFVLEDVVRKIRLYVDEGLSVGADVVLEGRCCGMWIRCCA